MPDGSAEVSCAPSTGAQVWAEQRGGHGHYVDLPEGTDVGREAWAGCAAAVARVAGAAS